MPTQEEILQQSPVKEVGDVDLSAFDNIMQGQAVEVEGAPKEVDLSYFDSIMGGQAAPAVEQPPAVTPPAVVDPVGEGGFLQDTGVGRGLVAGTKEFIGSAGLALEEGALKVNDAFRWMNDQVIKSERFTNWLNEQDERIRDNISGVQEYKADVPAMQGGVGEFFGQLIPQTALFATAILSRNPALAKAAVGTMGFSSVGSGLDTYTQYKEAKGEEVDELEKWGAGLAYGLAEFIPERIGLGFLMPKGATTKVAGKILGQNIDKVAKGGKEMIEDLIKANPTKTRALLRSLGTATTAEAAQESVTELMNMTTDRYLIGMDIDAKEFGTRLAHAAAGGAAMGGMLAPFSAYSQRAVDKSRREQLGSVTVAQDEMGQTWELVDTKDGLVGFSPSGKVNKNLDPKLKEKAVTLDLETFNRMTEATREAGGLSDEMFREEQHRALRGHVVRQLNTYGHTDGKLHLWKDEKELDEATGLPKEYFVISEDAGMAVLMDREGNRRIESSKEIAPQTEVLDEQQIFEQVRQRFDEANPLEPITADSEPDTFTLKGKEYKVTDVSPERLWTAAQIDENGATTGEVIQLTPEEQQAITEELLASPESRPDVRVIEAGGQQYKLVPTEDGNTIVDGISTKEEAEAAAQNIMETLGDKLTVEVTRVDSGDAYTPDTYTVKLSETPTVKKQEPTYRMAGQDITREDAAAFAAAAESAEELQGLEVEGDEEIQGVIEQRFAPEYKFKGVPVSQMMAQAMISAGRTEGLEVINDPAMEAQLKGPEEVAEEGPQVEEAVEAQPVVDEAKMAQEGQNLVPEEVSRELTVDEEGNVTFVHYSEDKLETLDPAVAAQQPSRISSPSEVAAKSSVGGVVDLYTHPDQKEPGTGKNEHVLKVPAHKVYHLQSDPLNFYEEAERRFKEAYPDRGFGPNEQGAWISKVANDHGFDVLLTDWAQGPIGKLTKPMKPTGGEFGERPSRTPVVGDRVDIGGEAWDVTEVGDKFIAMKNETGSRSIPVARADAMIGKFLPKAEKAEEPVVKKQEETTAEKKYSEQEVDRISGLEAAAEDGATLNLDGTKYEEGGLVVPVNSLNTTQGELSQDMIDKFIEDNKESIPEGASSVKVGLYKFPDSDQVSIDLNVVVSPEHREAALEFGKLAGQESLFNLNTFENDKTGADGKDPMKFTPVQFKEIASALSEGRVPDVVQPKQETKKQKPIEQAEKEVNTEPTEGQKEAGNYKKGHTKVQGFDISIENPKGSTRKGTDQSGKAWETKMKNTYGYFKRTKGKDGDQIDVFLGPNPEGGKIFVVDQVDPKTGKFDEHKVMMGFDSRQEAIAAYNSNYSKGWKGAGPVVEVGKEAFAKWLNVEQTGKRGKRLPISYIGINRVNYPTNPAGTTRMVFAEKAKEAIHRSLSIIAPDTEVILAATKEDFFKAAGGIKDFNPNDKGLLISRGDKHTIVINVPRMSTTTAAHELSHVVFATILKASPMHLNGLKADVADAIAGEYKTHLEAFSSGYAQIDQGEEFFSELTALMTLRDVPRTTVQKIKEVLNKWFDRTLGIKPFTKAAKAKDILDFFQNLAGQIREGQVISEASIDLRKLGLNPIAGYNMDNSGGLSAKRQANVIRNREETLEGYGLKGKKRYTVREIGEALQRRTRKEYTKIPLDKRTPQAKSKIADYMVDELVFELTTKDAKSAVGWYTTKYQAALDKLAETIPSLKEQDNRDVFTMFLAVTSDGQKVQKNFELAVKAYKMYEKNGKVDVDKFTEGGDRNASIKRNLGRINKLVEGRDIQELKAELLEEKTVGELRKEDKDFKSNYMVTETVPKAAGVFGEKLGAFYANLSGSTGYLTMDRWWSRTFNRYRGQLLPEIPGSAKAPVDTKGRKIGLARFKDIIGQPNITDRKALAEASKLAKQYADKGFKNGTTEEKAANTLYKAAFVSLNDIPKNSSDRSFMIDTAKMARERLSEKFGYDVTLADLQAILWYYEKRLYGELSGIEPLDVSYEDAAKKAAEGVKSQEQAAETDSPNPYTVVPNGNLATVAEHIDNMIGVKEDVVEEPVVKLQKAPPVESKSFKDWFGNSKVVDEKGAPLEVFHGSPLAGIGQLIVGGGKVQSSGLRESGVYFTNNRSTAELYRDHKTLTKETQQEIEIAIARLQNAQNEVRNNRDFELLDKVIQRERRKLMGEIYSAYVKMENPLVVDAKGKTWYEARQDLSVDLGYKTAYGAEALQALAGENAAAKDLGYDGVIFKNVLEMSTTQPEKFSEYLGDTYLTFDPDNIRLKPKEEVKRQAAWHGSGNRFDKFSTEFMGTGEGAQKYGWGLYFTEVEGIARGYAKAMGQSQLRMGGKSFYDVEALEPLLSDYDFLMEVDTPKGVLSYAGKQKEGAQDRIELFEEALEEVDTEAKEEAEKINDKIENEIKPEIQDHETMLNGLDKSDFDPDTKAYVKERMEQKLDYLEAELKGLQERNTAEFQKDLLVAKYKDALEYWNSLKDSAQYILDNADNITSKSSRHVYKVKIHGDKTLDELNFMRWEKPVPKEQIEGILSADIDGTVAEGLFEWLNERYEVRSNTDLAEVVVDEEITGQELYKGLTRSMSPQDASMALLNAGVDGIHYPAQFLTGGRKDGALNYVVFDDAAIEIEEVVRFQKEKPKPDAKQLQGFGDKVRNVFQDNMLAVRNWQESLKREGIKIRNFEDAYMKENLSHGRILNKMEKFTKREGDRLIKAVSSFIKAGGLTMDEAKNYVIAKHGPERNRWFWEQAEGNKGKDFSGLTELKEKVVAEAEPAEAMLLEAMPLNDFADYYARTLEDKVGAEKVDVLKKAVNEATDFALKELKDSGFLSQEQYDGLKGRYNYYVPLRGWSETDEWDYSSQFGRASSPLKQAKGRKSLADDPFAYILNMANTAVVAAERNRIAQATGNLVRNNRKAMEPYAEFKPVYFVKTEDLDEAGQPIIYETIDRPEQQLWEEGRVTMKVPTEYKQRKSQAQAQEHEVTFHENGQKMVLVMKNPEIARALMGNKGTDWTTGWNNAVNSPMLKIGDKTVIGAPAAATRYLSSVMTSMNPAFVLPNMARDIPLAILSEFVHGTTKDAMTMVPNLRKAEGAIRRYLAGKSRTTDRIDQLYAEFLESGAATGFIHQRDVDHYRKELERGLKDANRTMNPVLMASRGMRYGIDAVEKLSEWSENLTRFAVYLNHRNKGRTADESATEAKNASVNFNRKGRLSPAINGLFAFFNAGVQAGDKYFKMWGSNWKKMAATHSFLAVQGFLSAMLMDLFGDEDEEGTKQYDKLSPYTRRNYLNVPMVGTGKVVTIPMPHVLRAFHGMGVSAYDMMTERVTPEEAIKETLGGIPSDIIPVDGSGLFNREGNLSLKPFMPTFAKPAYELAINENFMGGMISPEPYTPKQRDMIADTKTARKNVNSAAQAITDALYELGGGDETGYRYVEKDGELHKIPNMLDLSPHTLEHLVNSYLGGTGKFIGNVYKTTEGVMKGGVNMLQGDDFKEAFEEVQLNSTPVVRRFVRTPSGDPLMGSYYDTKREVERWKQILDFHEKDMSVEGVNKYIDLWSEIGMPISTFELQYDVIDNVNDAVIQMQQMGDDAGMDAFEKEKRAAMQEAVKSWEEK